MKSNLIGKLALVLWGLTIAILGWLFVFGQTAPGGTDSREIIRLAPAERDLVLKEMRGLLVATHGILEGLSTGDPDRVSREARAAGMAAAADVNPALMAKLPLAFKSLGMSVHADMDEISRAAASGEPSSQLLGKMAATLSKCVSCHATWQLHQDTQN